MRGFWSDLRYGARMLVKRPGFTLIAVLTLALGIGANTAIFSVVNAVLLRPLPYEEPDRLVRVWGVNIQRGRDRRPFSPHDFADWKEQNRVFESIAVCDAWSPSLTGTGDPERIDAAKVSSSFFSILRIQPMLGHHFLPEHDQRGNERVAILSHGLWQRRFGADPNVVGRSVTLNGQSYEVIAVMPSGFRPPRLSGEDASEPELWAPFTFDPSTWSRSGRAVDAAIARLKPGISLAQAQAEMSAIASRLAEQYPETNTGYGLRVIPLHEQTVGGAKLALLTLLAAVGFVLLIACANVANLMLARATARHREIAIRAALGAGRFRLFRQLLAESMLLALTGGVAGLLLSLWTTDVLLGLSAGSIPRLNGVRLDAWVLGFTLLTSLATGIVFGVIPAVQASKTNLNEMLKEGDRGSPGSSGRQRVGRLLVISEVALSLVLLIGAGLLIRSFALVQQVEPGFDPKNLLTASIHLPGARYPEDHQMINFFNQVIARLQTQAGVRSAAVVSVLPISGNFDTTGVRIEGRPEPERGQEISPDRYVISRDYFRTMGIPLLKGRPFDEQDRTGNPEVVIISQTMASRLWPGEDPLGKRIKPGPPDAPWRSIVGIVGDVKQYGLDTDSTMQMYLPHDQYPWQWMTLVARTDSDPAGLVATVRRQVLAVDQDQPIFDIQTMEQLMSASISRRRFQMLLLAIFSALALALAAVGIYGVLSYMVTQRTHEIGVRLALGARRSDIFKLVVGQGLMLALTGVSIGLAASLALTRLMSSLLFGVGATDPLTFASIALFLTVVALVACLVPARRAMKVDPMVALRYE